MIGHDGKALRAASGYKLGRRVTVERGNKRLRQDGVVGYCLIRLAYFTHEAGFPFRHPDKSINIACIPMTSLIYINSLSQWRIYFVSCTLPTQALDTAQAIAS